MNCHVLLHASYVILTEASNCFVYLFVVVVVDDDVYCFVCMLLMIMFIALFVYCCCLCFVRLSFVANFSSTCKVFPMVVQARKQRTIRTAIGTRSHTHHSCSARVFWLCAALPHVTAKREDSKTPQSLC